MKSIQLILVLTLLACNSFAQKIIARVTMETSSEKRNEIVYRKGTKLELSDFQGPEEPNMNAVAMAYSGISLRYSGSMQKGLIVLNIKMYCSFDKSRSWCLPGSRNERTLAHEQRHFDITALSACDLYRELQQYTFTKNFEREIAELQRKYREQNEAEQDRYDKEANHGINTEEQEQWNQKITKSIDNCTDCYQH
ncbi:MAG TPA: hypothetical protein VL092_05055 [Chitinophagaceae bacterium]|nr:hypothetical protein [Chitinophagaceae bacterium]